LGVLYDTDLGVRGYTGTALGNLVVADTDIRRVQKTAFHLWWAASDKAIEALEKAANRLSVLEVQENPGSDPLCHKKG
jgi:hypothetical protein